MDARKELVERLKKMDGQFSGYEIFSDWVKMMALTLANGFVWKKDDLWEQRENEYLSLAKKYGPEMVREFCDMYGLLVAALDAEITDVLGYVFMAAGLGSKMTGQFFTPFHISYMMADLQIPKDVSYKKPYTLNEPSCGGGGLCIACARVLLERGLNPQRCLRVIAQDLDWKGVYMTYVQLSLLGINAIVVQGGTLSEPYVDGYPEYRVLRTPAHKGLLIS